MDNKRKLSILIKRARITQKEAAALIEVETKRPCSLRSIQAWLASSDHKSARPCPDWAFLALEARIKYKKNVM